MTAAFCREAEQKRQAIALEKQQAAEAKERELAAQHAQREAERQALRRLQKNFGVRMEGSAAVDKPPKVTTPAFLSLMEKKRKDYAFRRQFDDKPSIIPGCPQGLSLMLHAKEKGIGIQRKGRKTLRGKEETTPFGVDVMRVLHVCLG